MGVSRGSLGRSSAIRHVCGVLLFLLLTSASVGQQPATQPQQSEPNPDLFYQTTVALLSSDYFAKSVENLRHALSAVKPSKLSRDQYDAIVAMGTASDEVLDYIWELHEHAVAREAKIAAGVQPNGEEEATEAGPSIDSLTYEPVRKDQGLKIHGVVSWKGETADPPFDSFRLDRFATDINGASGWEPVVNPTYKELGLHATHTEGTAKRVDVEFELGKDDLDGSERFRLVIENAADQALDIAEATPEPGLAISSLSYDPKQDGLALEEVEFRGDVSWNQSAGAEPPFKDLRLERYNPEATEADPKEGWRDVKTFAQDELNLRSTGSGGDTSRAEFELKVKGDAVKDSKRFRLIAEDAGGDILSVREATGRYNQPLWGNWPSSEYQLFLRAGVELSEFEDSTTSAWYSALFYGRPQTLRGKMDRFDNWPQLRHANPRHWYVPDYWIELSRSQIPFTTNGGTDDQELDTGVRLRLGLFWPLLEYSVSTAREYGEFKYFSSGSIDVSVGPVVHFGEDFGFDEDEGSDDLLHHYYGGLRLANHPTQFLELTVGESETLEGTRFQLVAEAPLYIHRDSGTRLSLRTLWNERLLGSSEDEVVQFGAYVNIPLTSIGSIIDALPFTGKPNGGDE